MDIYTMKDKIKTFAFKNNFEKKIMINCSSKGW